MTKLKFAGFCVAGLGTDLACAAVSLLLTEILNNFFSMGFRDSLLVFIIAGVVTCIGSGFAHNAFRNIIREKLRIRSIWYTVAVFGVPMILGGLGVPLAWVLGQTIWTGWDKLGYAMSLFIYSIIVCLTSILCYISTKCVEARFGCDEPAPPEKPDKTKDEI